MKDMLGNEIEVGTHIVAAFVQSSSAYLRTGHVTELIPEKPRSYYTMPERVRVKWEQKTHLYGGKGESLINVAGNKVLVIKD